jgi:hypothetical protein
MDRIFRAHMRMLQIPSPKADRKRFQEQVMVESAHAEFLEKYGSWGIGTGGTERPGHCGDQRVSITPICLGRCLLQRR